VAAQAARESQADWKGGCRILTGRTGRPSARPDFSPMAVLVWRRRFGSREPSKIS